MFAVADVIVGGEKVNAQSGNTVVIPVEIKNNTGIMGFKITVEYDADVLSAPGVIRGDLTENGNFNNSIGVTSDGSFDIVWSDIEDGKGDGTIALLSFFVDEKLTSETVLHIDYSQPDTFNEAWEDVELICEDITIVINTDDSVKTLPQNSTTLSLPNNDEIKQAVDIVLDEFDLDRVEDVKGESAAEIVERVNEVLSQLGESDGKYFENKEHLKDAYSSAVSEKFIESVIASANSDEIKNVIDSALDAVNSDSVESVPKEKREDFINIVENQLGDKITDFEKISDKLSTEEAVDAIAKLYGENAEAATQGTQVPVTLEKNNTAKYVAAVGGAFALAVISVIVAVLYKKRKHKNKEEINQ